MLMKIVRLFVYGVFAFLAACAGVDNGVHFGSVGKPNSIALLLPLQGNLASQANAIRNGFLAAYYQAKETGNAPNVTVLDTSQGNIVAVYQQAVQQGANLIVGPLTKNELVQLAKTRLAVPVLALNSVPQLRVSNLYQFALSPLDEAQQMAQKAWADNHRVALIIAPANAWGQGISQVLVRQWQSQGGQIAGQMNYSNQQSLASQVAQLLNIDVAAEAHANKLKHMYNKKSDFVPMPRTNADVIFLIAQPSLARQIKPMLNYYFADKIPVYANSTVYSGMPNSNDDRDMNGIIFCDIPWVLAPQNLPSNLATVQQRIQALWAASYFQNRKLYAFGVDAYNLATNLNISTLQGATGTLTMTGDRVIYRKLIWAQFNNGTPQVISY